MRRACVEPAPRISSTSSTSSWRPAQAWATPRTLSSARLADAEDYVDAVYMVLAAAARTQASAARNAALQRDTPAQARSLARQAAGSPAASDGATLAWNPFKGSTSNGTLNPKSLYLGWLGRAILATQGERLGGFYPRASNHFCTPET